MNNRADLEEIVFSGIGVSPGIVHAKAFVLPPDEFEFEEKIIDEILVESEVRRFNSAIDLTASQLQQIQKQIDGVVGPNSSAIIEAHLLMLWDPSFVGDITKAIKTKFFSAETAVWSATQNYITILSAINDPYIRERIADIQDVSDRVLKNLFGRQKCMLSDIKEPCIVIAKDLSPSETASLDKSVVHGFAINLGSETSHTAILARSLDIPSVVGLHDITRYVETGSDLLIDGAKGLLIINPSEERLAEYLEAAQGQAKIRSRFSETTDLPAETLDGYRVTLSANIEDPSEAQSVIDCGAQGVGLYRSEYLFMDREELPSEEEQFLAYSQVAEALHPQSVVIRTLDIGGDKKFAGNSRIPKEENPFLGWRAVRYCLANPDVFKTQLRALLRASVRTNLRIMYPMITCVSELISANELLEECKKELEAEGVAFNKSLETGAMIEVPSAALTVHLLAPHVKFFSLGTNDLIQYTMAVDRVNENVAHLYKPTHLAILNLIKQVVDTAHQHGVWVSLCGEMGGDPILAPLLIGLGVDELSVSLSRLTMIKYVLRKMRYSQIVELAEQSAYCSSPEEVLERCENLLAEVDKDVLEIIK